MRLPNKLSDGMYTYTKVRDSISQPDGSTLVALYERDPKDAKYQFTPDLAYCTGQVKVPVMHTIQR